MFWRAEYRRCAEYREGFMDQATVAMGIGAWGLMTGVAMVKSGMSVFEALLMTLVVYAGSAQLAAVPMIMAGAPLWVILVAALCVNLRFVVFSAHLRPYMMHMPRLRRVVSGFVTGDLSYVFFARKYPHPGTSTDELTRQQAYLMGNCAVNFVCWMVASVVGVLMANAIPTAWGLGFAGILALLGVMSSLATSPLRMVSVTVSGAAAVVAWALPLKLNILVAITCAVVICLLLEKTPPFRREGSRHV